MISVMMKSVSTVMAYCTGFRLLTVLAMLCATVSHIYARVKLGRKNDSKISTPIEYLLMKFAKKSALF